MHLKKTHRICHQNNVLLKSSIMGYHCISGDRDNSKMFSKQREKGIIKSLNFALNFTKKIIENWL